MNHMERSIVVPSCGVTECSIAERSIMEVSASPIAADISSDLPSMATLTWELMLYCAIDIDNAGISIMSSPYPLYYMQISKFD